MLISVKRQTSNKEATLSMIYVDGVFYCFGLEDEYREHKLPGETRIPAGRYKVGVRDTGGFHSRYKKKFSFHQGMLQVKNVPNFEFILIHIGNTDQDTAGCLLVGMGCNIGDQITIANSTTAYRKLYNLVIDSAKMDALEIEYVDLD